jgi:glycosyltransferase involved in cell wall biosynthesis
MPQRTPHPTPPRVAAIVPAFNEAETLADVLTVLKETSLVDEVLVVSDGSTDGTVDVARSLGVKVLHLRRNYGKAMAMAIGVAHTSAEAVLFVDADVLNLSDYLLAQLVEPVQEGRADMVIGVRHRGWPIDVVHRNFGPLLSGLRCLRREIFESVPDEYLKGYTVETALNWTAGRLGLRSETVVFHNLRHVVKERKRGVAAGLRARYEMFKAVFLAWLGLTWKRPGLRHAASPGRPIRPEPEYINW